ncbi:free fatty acid receptor 4 [Malaclemys terrapin pileata]|uniref:free fatty acid receptor 4 n=1 Tax=Malaclemys terrapin pileata TaxID=2991368 RepID=UPI0023A90B34|nr:free fatty acid receptor 4 [Malaclemys terrapin pileata]
MSKEEEEMRLLSAHSPGQYPPLAPATLTCHPAPLLGTWVPGLGAAAASLALVVCDALGASQMPGACVTPQGNCTRFPFFSDFKGQNKVALSAVETAVLSCIFLVSLLVNICAISLLARKKKKLRTANCLMLNLFCADLLFISAIPAILVVRWTESWVLGDVVCHMLFYVISLSGSVTILSLAAVSLERVVCIVRLRHTARFSCKLLVGTLLVIWGLAALATLPLCLFFNVEPLLMHGKEVQICTLVWPSIAGEISWDVTFTFVVFVIPGLVIVISYTKILQITKASRRRLNVSLAYSEIHQIRVSQQDYKLFRTLFVLMISFFIMWGPIVITILLILVQNFKHDLNILPSFFFWIMAFTFANSAVNPVLYNVTHFRHEWRQFLLCCAALPGRRMTHTETTGRRNDHRESNLSVIYK